MESESSFPKLLSSLAVLLSCFLIICSDAQLLNISDDASSPYPPGFLFGAASSAYQYEGAYLADGKGLSNWDVFTRRPGYIADGSNGDVSVDFYHRYEEIVDLMVPVGLNSFQFSISWARILPKGRYGGINVAGIDYYNKLIDTLLSRGIEPFVVLHHFDFPLELEKRYKSWLSPESVKDFKYFADICFKNFGDRIKYWTTFSEPNMMVILEYQVGLYPPGRCAISYGSCEEGEPHEPFVAAHNIILAHAAAVKLYKTKYQKEQGGQIGLVVETTWFVPLSNSTADKLAAERAQSFFSNWFFDPIVFGRYPKEMTDILGSALPTFSSNDLEDLKLGVDFMGINHYTSSYVWDCTNKSCGSKWFGYVGQSTSKDGIPLGEPTGMDPFVTYPKGFENIMNYVKERLNNIPMYITENGFQRIGFIERKDVSSAVLSSFENEHPFSEINIPANGRPVLKAVGLGYCEKSDSSSTLEDSLNDDKRIEFLTDYLGALTRAIRGGANVKGYFLWTLLDNFEWNFGYTKRYGIHHVDFKTKKITPKSSAAWYKQFIERHKTVGAIVPETNSQLVQAQ